MADSPIDVEVTKTLAAMKKITANQKYLANCSKSLCKSLRRTAHVLAGAAADYYDARIDQHNSATSTQLKGVTERLAKLEKVPAVVNAQIAKSLKKSISRGAIKTK